MNTNFKPDCADFDGDSYSHFEFAYETASKSVAAIKEEISFDDKCKLLIKYTDITASKLRNMSRRQKKIAIQMYSKTNGLYDIRNGQLIAARKRHHRYAAIIPITHTYEEVVGKPMTDFLKTWTDCALL